MSHESFTDRVEELRAAKIELVLDQRWRRVKPVVQRVGRYHLVGRSGLQHDRGALLAGDVDAALRANRRGEHVGYALQALQLVMRLARLRIERREDARVPLQQVDDAV